jgi:hypothetical protein
VRGARRLAAGARETLCLQVHLPLETGNAYQGLRTRAEVTFVAEQS